MDNTQTASAQFEQLVADEWEFRMQEDPLFATTTGDHRFNDRLPGVSEANYARRLARMREFHELLPGSGAVPLDVLENMVAEWINQQQ